jgi:hypothetical protein
LFTVNADSAHLTALLDEISSIFIPDYNLIVNSELQVLQIHRLVWLAAVRATQQQRGNDPYYRRMPPEQLLSHALDEIVRRLDMFVVIEYLDVLFRFTLIDFAQGESDQRADR